MSLKDDKQQNIQMQLDFSSEPTGASVITSKPAIHNHLKTGQR